MVRQERVFFRNIPLTNWIEQEMPFEEGTDMEKLTQTVAMFTPELLLAPPVADPKRIGPRKKLRRTD